MSTPNDGGPAFPCEGGDTSGLHPSAGMSLRDYFAGQALVGELASTSGSESADCIAKAAVKAGRDVAYHLAITCYEMADAMLAAREKGGQE